jgi:hypothetical protein
LQALVLLCVELERAHVDMDNASIRLLDNLREVIGGLTHAFGRLFESVASDIFSHVHGFQASARGCLSAPLSACSRYFPTIGANGTELTSSLHPLTLL